MTCRRKVRLANGREATALEIQREYFEKATRFIDRRDDPVAKKVVSMWGHVLDALETQELDRIGRQVDWVTKYLLIERARVRHNLPLSHPKIALMDLTYHDVNRKRGLYYLLERSGAVERICDDRAIDRATQEPPQTTRARLRGEFIRQAKERRRDYTVDWVHLKLNDQAQRTVLCKDPFRAHDDRVDKLIASM
jgi:proteasome accessory factor A